MTDTTVNSIATTLARQLSGATAVVLTGSHARGDAGQYSDIDLYAIGTGSRYALELHDGRLVSISWRTVDEVLDEFQSPGTAGAAVPGWRSALILLDPVGVAQRLKERACRWTWEDTGNDVIAGWLGDELSGLAEEVFKLIAMLDSGQWQAAAVQRSILALRLPVLMAVHLRMLYDSENALWDRVSVQMGGDWAYAQATALGVRDHPFQDTCRAALRLYQMAADILDGELNVIQRQVVQAANQRVEKPDIPT